MHELMVFQSVLKKFGIHPTNVYWLANHYFETGKSPEQVTAQMMADGEIREDGNLYITLPNQIVTSFCLMVLVGLVVLPNVKQIGGGN
jgi:hypothetical protein